MDHVILWGSIADRKLLCGAPEATEGKGESSQFAEVKADQLALDVAERRDGQCFIFILIRGWWQMLYGGGCSSGNKTTGNEGVNLFRLLNCGKILLPK